jgi:uncharacterized protein (DUF2141 family)
LFSWWSPQRRDNFATTQADWAIPTTSVRWRGEDLSNNVVRQGYALHRLEGFLNSSPQTAQYSGLWLTVRVQGFGSAVGSAAIAVYDGPDGFPGEARNVLQAAFLPISNGSATMNVGVNGAGTFAVAAYHDRNANGMLDRNHIPIVNIATNPSEPWGVSRGHRGSPTGPPSFDDAKFYLSQSQLVTVYVQ